MTNFCISFEITEKRANGGASIFEALAADAAGEDELDANQGAAALLHAQSLPVIPRSHPEALPPHVQVALSCFFELAARLQYLQT